MSSLITSVQQSDIKMHSNRSFGVFSLILLLLVFCSMSLNAIEIDLSRRKINSLENTGTVLDSVLTSISDPVQPIVILNTEKEFVPNTIRLKKNNNYKFYVVNVNKNEKNAAFVLDSFNQQYGTPFGDVIVFDVKPKVTGLFPFSCPVTGYKGKIVVISDEHSEEAAVSSAH